MSYSKEQIANLALAKVGDEAGQITSFTQNSKEANLVNKFYEPSLREVLRMHTWNCAKERVQLAQSTTDPAFGWDNSFPLPADCIRPLAFYSSSSSQRAIRENVEWKIEGRNLFTNADAAYLLYIKYLTDPNTMDELFIRCLYTHLAIKLAYPLTEDQAMVRMLEDEMNSVIMPEARRVNSFEGYEIPSVDSDWLEATYISGSETNRPFGTTTYGTF